MIGGGKWEDIEIRASLHAEELKEPSNNSCRTLWTMGTSVLQFLLRTSGNAHHGSIMGHQGPFAAPTASELDEHAAYLSPIAMLLHGPCSYCWNSAASCCALKTRLWASFLSGTWACSSCAVCLASQLLLLLTSSLKCDLTNSGYCFLVH